MTWETGFVFGVIGLASLLFASGKVRLDVVALLVVLALGLSGVLTVSESLAGFGDPVVILVAGLLVVGEMLRSTGVATTIGNWLVKTGGNNETRIISLLMLVSAGMGAIMSSTAVVAILIPVVQNISSKTRLNPSRLLMPMSFGALISGMLTLIATTPNLVINAELHRSGHDAFNFFSFTPIGLAVLIVAGIYMLVIGRRLLPGEETLPTTTASLGMLDMLEQYGVAGQAKRLVIRPNSELAGQPLKKTRLGSEFSLQVVLVERVGRFGVFMTITPHADFVLRAEDVLLVHDLAGNAEDAATALGLEAQVITDAHRRSWMRELGMAAVMINPESRLMGQTVKGAGFRGRYGFQILAVKRKGEVLEDFGEKQLQAGDSLLVVGTWRKIKRLRTDAHDLVLFSTPAEFQDVAPEVRRLPTALVILAVMVALSALEIMPVVLAVLLAALAAVGARILTMEDSYRAIHWSSIVLIAGMLPIAAALEKTGGTDLIVTALVDSFGGAGPYGMLSVIFFMTAGMGLFLSNTATAVLMGPIAIQIAGYLGVAPYPFAMTVAIAASAAFMTPVSTPVVTLVVEPGHYRFMDFVKVGGPLTILVWLVTVLLTPVIFPF